MPFWEKVRAFEFVSSANNSIIYLFEKEGILSIGGWHRLFV